MGELSLHDEIYNVIGCLEYWIAEAKERFAPIDTEESRILTEDEMRVDDSEKALAFLTEFDLTLRKASEIGKPIMIEP